MCRPSRFAVATAAVLSLTVVVACGERKKGLATRRGAAVDPLEMKPRLAPPRAPARRGGSIAAILAAPGSDEARYQALDRLVKGWPATRKALPVALRLLREDASIRGGVALSLARLGLPLAREIVAMVGRAPKEKRTLLAAGVVAYHLVSPTGLQKRSAEEREAIRRALAPIAPPLWEAFMAERTPEYEIYQGVAVAAAATVRRFRPPFPQGGLTRVAMVLYLVLTAKKDEVFLPKAQRDALREQAAPLAAYFAKALTVAKADGSGESPDSLVLGLAVLGTAGSAAVAQEKALRTPLRCPAVVKTLLSIEEQVGAAAVVPARGLLQRCIDLLPDPGLTQQAKRLLGKVAKP